MKQKTPEEILKQLGNVRWSESADSFIVETELGAILRLCSNSDTDIDLGVHIDEIAVPENLQRKGIGTHALRALCRLADEYQFELKGGPVGWSENPWSQKFVDWIRRFQFEQNPSPNLPPIDDATAFYVRRLPQKIS